MNRAMNLIKVSVPTAALLLAAASAQAFEFGEGDWSGSLDTTVSYGASWRANDLDPDNVGQAYHDPLVVGLTYLQRREFDLPLDPEGTEFQRQTWNALRQIPYGATSTYAELARSIGRPKAVRAVGAANGRNPLPIAATRSGRRCRRLALGCPAPRRRPPPRRPPARPARPGPIRSRAGTGSSGDAP